MVVFVFQFEVVKHQEQFDGIDGQQFDGEFGIVAEHGVFAIRIESIGE